MQTYPNPDPGSHPAKSDRTLGRILEHLSHTMERDALVQQTTRELREMLQVDRVVLYYFYREWKGQVTFESLSDDRYSIYGSTGPDECFNGEYAALYLEGRVRAIPDIDLEPIAECHREFLRQMQVRANLVVPVLIPRGLWGLLVAHHCQAPYAWSQKHIDHLRSAAQTLAMAPAIRDS